MARFQFRLSSLLALREAARTRCRVELAAAQAAQAEAQFEREAVDRQLGEQRDSARRAPGRLDVPACQAAERFESTLRQQLRIIEQRQGALAAETERLTEAVMAVDREARALEKLRQRQLERFGQREASQERKQIDEQNMALNRAQSID